MATGARGIAPPVNDLLNCGAIITKWVKIQPQLIEKLEKLPADHEEIDDLLNQAEELINKCESLKEKLSDGIVKDRTTKQETRTAVEAIITQIKQIYSIREALLKDGGTFDQTTFPAEDAADIANSFKPAEAEITHSLAAHEKASSFFNLPPPPPHEGRSSKTHKKKKKRTKAENSHEVLENSEKTRSFPKIVMVEGGFPDFKDDYKQTSTEEVDIAGGMKPVVTDETEFNPFEDADLMFKDKFTPFGDGMNFFPLNSGNLNPPVIGEGNVGAPQSSLNRVGVAATGAEFGSARAPQWNVNGGEVPASWMPGDHPPSGIQYPTVSQVLHSSPVGLPVSNSPLAPLPNGQNYLPSPLAQPLASFQRGVLPPVDNYMLKVPHTTQTKTELALPQEVQVEKPPPPPPASHSPMLLRLRTFGLKGLHPRTVYQLIYTIKGETAALDSSAALLSNQSNLTHTSLMEVSDSIASTNRVCTLDDGSGFTEEESCLALPDGIEIESLACSVRVLHGTTGKTVGNINLPLKHLIDLGCYRKRYTLTIAGIELPCVLDLELSLEEDSTRLESAGVEPTGEEKQAPSKAKPKKEDAKVSTVISTIGNIQSQMLSVLEKLQELDIKKESKVEGSPVSNDLKDKVLSFTDAPKASTDSFKALDAKSEASRDFQLEETVFDQLMDNMVEKAAMSRARLKVEKQASEIVNGAAQSNEANKKKASKIRSSGSKEFHSLGDLGIESTSFREGLIYSKLVGGLPDSKSLSYFDIAQEDLRLPMFGYSSMEEWKQTKLCSARDLSGLAEMMNHMDRSDLGATSIKYCKLLQADTGVLFQDEYCLICLNTKIIKNQARFVLFVATKNRALHNFQVEVIPNYSTAPVEFIDQNISIPSLLPQKPLMLYGRVGPLLGTYQYSPELKISFSSSEGLSKMLPLRLPFPCFIFCKSLTLSSVEFFKTWKSSTFVQGSLIFKCEMDNRFCDFDGFEKLKQTLSFKGCFYTDADVAVSGKCVLASGRFEYIRSALEPVTCLVFFECGRNSETFSKARVEIRCPSSYLCSSVKDGIIEAVSPIDQWSRDFANVLHGTPLRQTTVH